MVKKAACMGEKWQKLVKKNGKNGKKQDKSSINGKDL